MLTNKNVLNVNKRFHDFALVYLFKFLVISYLPCF